MNPPLSFQTDNEIVQLKRKIDVLNDANETLGKETISRVLENEKLTEKLERFNALLSRAYHVLGENVPSDNAVQLREDISIELHSN